MSISTPTRRRKPPKEEASLDQVMAEVRQLREAVERDRAEIERLKSELSRVQATEEPDRVLVQRPTRMKLTAEESLRRVESFPERRDEFVASIREGKNRSLPS